MVAALTAACSSHDAPSKQSAPATTTVPASSGHAKRPRAGRSNTSIPVARTDGGGRTIDVPASIKADCSADVTSALQSWIDQLPDHVTAQLGAGACYRIEGTLQIADRKAFVLDGNGATLRAITAGSGGRLSRRRRAQLNIASSQNVVVRDVIVRGANPHAGLAAAAYQVDLEAQHAFSLHGDDGVVLDRVQAYDVYGDFVYVGGTGQTPSRNVTVMRSRFDRNGRQGISVTDADGVTITGNRISDVRRSVFDLEPNTRAGEARHIRIEGNTTGPAVNYWLANKGSGINIGDVVVARNVMEKPTGALVIVSGPKFGKRGPFTFVDNRFQTTAAVTDEDATGAFLFENAGDVSVRGNTVRVPARARLAGVELRGTSNVVVHDNRFLGVTTPVKRDAASRNVSVVPAATPPKR